MTYEKINETEFKYRGQVYSVYQNPSEDEMLTWMKMFQKIFPSVCDRIGLIATDYYVDDHLLAEAFIRLDKRRLHYFMYHDISMDQIRPLRKLEWIGKI